MVDIAKNSMGHVFFNRVRRLSIQVYKQIQLPGLWQLPNSAFFLLSCQASAFWGDRVGVRLAYYRPISGRIQPDIKAILE